MTIQQITIDLIQFALEQTDYEFLIDDLISNQKDRIAFIFASLAIKAEYNGEPMLEYLTDENWENINNILASEIHEREHQLIVEEDINKERQK